ncbi:ABC transporter ATP-binding protein [Caldicoprobacter algeriensis]|uniref:ABC transporter ATP-binding protein n=1 Tax=Caldicoprobacter algeriensis TaxID=699281 RepID=UPI0020795062|nr:ABC transporter ATP-binding protein [Caldicoprobacter algeriensis]MCM8900946.1 ABC transporter ATP-binding protein [Caldicoprobacter algeriensis]
MAILKVERLRFAYGAVEVLKGIDLSIERNMVLGIIGANGSGKTTLLKNISGYLRPVYGSVSILGKNIMDYGIKERARYIGYVPQDGMYNLEFTCYDIVMMGRMPYLRRFQTETKQDRDIVKECMEATNTWYLKDRSIRHLSGGERQRVYIARALAQRPKILLMDEPVSHLDIKYQIEILSLVRGLASTGLLVIVVLHDINLASEFCDEILIMKEGQMIACGPPAEVLTRDNMISAFSVDASIIENPVSGKPYVIPYLGMGNKGKR